MDVTINKIKRNEIEMTQKRIISEATQRVEKRRVEAEELKTLMENNPLLNTLCNLLKVVEFESTVFSAVDRTDTEYNNVVIEFYGDTDSEGILDGFDYEVYGDKFFITEKVVAHV